MNNTMAMRTIGKTVVIAGDKVLLAKDATTGVMDGQVTANITTSGNATLKLFDKSGKEVGSRSLGYHGHWTPDVRRRRRGQGSPPKGPTRSRST